MSRQASATLDALAALTERNPDGLTWASLEAIGRKRAELGSAHGNDPRSIRRHVGELQRAGRILRFRAFRVWDRANARPVWDFYTFVLERDDAGRWVGRSENARLLIHGAPRMDAYFRGPYYDAKQPRKGRRVVSYADLAPVDVEAACAAAARQGLLLLQGGQNAENLSPQVEEGESGLSEVSAFQAGGVGETAPTEETRAQPTACAVNAQSGPPLQARALQHSRTECASSEDWSRVQEWDRARERYVGKLRGRTWGVFQGAEGEVNLRRQLREYLERLPSHAHAIDFCRAIWWEIKRRRAVDPDKCARGVMLNIPKPSSWVDVIREGQIQAFRAELDGRPAEEPQERTRATAALPSADIEDRLAEDLHELRMRVQGALLRRAPNLVSAWTRNLDDAVARAGNDQAGLRGVIDGLRRQAQALRAA